MNGLKDLAKGGWHPDGKSGGKESWRGEFKGIQQVAGWMGKGKDTSNSESRSNQPRPLASLRDPTSFGAPPKHKFAPPVRSGLGDTNYSPDSRSSASRTARQEESPVDEEEAEKPSGPYLANTTGLDASNFPPPPPRSSAGATPAASSEERAPPKVKPSLPPRLPPRQDARLPTSTVVSPTVSAAHINEGAVERLGKSGISVPGFGIGSNQGSTTAPTSSSKSISVSGLQSKFSKLNTSLPAGTAAGATAWSQQGVIQTNTATNNTSPSATDPGSVSIADIRNTARAANEINEKHGEQITAGLKTANNMDQKYGIANKFNEYSSRSNTQASGVRSIPTSPTQGSGSRKAPPPVPSKAALMSRFSGSLS